MYKRLSILFFFLFHFTSSGTGINFNADTLTIGFWNVENLFDTLNDPKINDEEFLPGSKSDWTAQRYTDKLKKLGRVIRSVNNGTGPDVLGLGEIENRGVIEDLVNLELKDLGYSIGHMDSPDERGIDVALIFKSNLFTMSELTGYKVELESRSPTRLILHAKLKFRNNQVLDFFINHWPSRRGGQDDSEKNRVKAATVLRSECDKLLNKNKKSEIIIMGDFNDEPVNVSIVETLAAKDAECKNAAKDIAFINLSFPLKNSGQGSYKYRDQWNMLDQIIVNRNLFNGNSKFAYVCGSFEIYKPDIMVTQSGNYKGSPARTYAGEKYLGGYSDHFPVFAKFYSK